MERKEALADVEKRLIILKEDSFAMDEIAGELLEERAKLQTEIGPVLAAIQNIEYKLADLTNRKTQLLVQYRMGVVVRESLEMEEDPAEAMEIQ